MRASRNWNTSPESKLIGQQDIGVEDQGMFLPDVPSRVGGAAGYETRSKLRSSPYLGTSDYISFLPNFRAFGSSVRIAGVERGPSKTFGVSGVQGLFYYYYYYYYYY